MFVILRPSIVVVILLTGAFLMLQGEGQMARAPKTGTETIRLPRPELRGDVSVEEALERRRSIRDFAKGPVSITAVSRLLWAAQGVSGPDGLRTAPSAGALYPCEVYLVAGKVDGLPSGLYKYRPKNHTLILIATDDLRRGLSKAALHQECVRDGAVAIVITAVYKRTTRKYGTRGHRYVHMEIGHIAQGVYLQAVSLGLGTVMIGAFEDDEVAAVLGLPDSEAPLAIMPVGKVK